VFASSFFLILFFFRTRGVIKAQDTQVGQPQNQQRGSRNQPHQQQRVGGSITVNWKGAAVNLNLEDLADLARSLCNVSTFSSSANLQGKNSAAEESFFKAIRVIKSDDKKSGEFS
jgi:hypothetical protein